MASADEHAGGWLRLCFLIGALLLWSAEAPLAEQAMTVSTGGGVLRVVAPTFEVIEGVILDRLRDGRSVQLDFELGVLAQPGGAAVAQSRQSFNVSFDLWEERFAVTLLTTPKRSVSHLSRKASEAWCIENLTVPLSALASFGRSTPFWVRLAYRVSDQPAAAGSDDETFTLQRLIEVLSRKRRDNQTGKIVEDGPFHLLK